MLKANKRTLIVTSIVTILPVLIVYIILSKSIIKGVTAGSVKG